MKSLKKDIKKEFFKDKTTEGETTPIVIRNGIIYIPTNEGVKKYGNRHNDRKQ